MTARTRALASRKDKGPLGGTFRPSIQGPDFVWTYVDVWIRGQRLKTRIKDQPIDVTLPAGLIWHLGETIYVSDGPRRPLVRIMTHDLLRDVVSGYITAGPILLNECARELLRRIRNERMSR